MDHLLSRERSFLSKAEATKEENRELSGVRAGFIFYLVLRDCGDTVFQKKKVFEKWIIL